MAHYLALQRAIVSLTDAQIKALPTTPITLVAAQGSGFRIKIIDATVKATIVGAYTNIDATYCSLQIEHAGPVILCTAITNDSGTTPALTNITTVLGTAQTTITDLIPNVYEATTVVYPVPMLATATDDVLVRIAIDNDGTGNLTGGNASNSLKVTLTYLVEPT